MNKTDFIQMLASDIEKEQIKFIEYKKQYESYRELHKTDPKAAWHHPYWELDKPSKARIKDDVKMIRRLALEISKEEI